MGRVTVHIWVKVIAKAEVWAEEEATYKAEKKKRGKLIDSK